MNRWIRRKCNSHGYGVQSPGDFYFVQHVLRETSPYYAYAELDQAGKVFSRALPHYPSRVNRLLFRLSNHVHPRTIIEVGTGSGLSAYTLSLGCSGARCITIGPCECPAQLAHSPRIDYRSGDEMATFDTILSTLGKVDLLHIGHTAHYREVLEKALPYVGDHTLIIIGGIRDDKAKHAWWQALMDSHTGIAYDVKEVGLLFFNTSRHKNTYWVKLKD